MLFNRFYQPDFDIDNLEVVPNLMLSTSHELLLRLNWVASSGISRPIFASPAACIPLPMY